MNAYEEFAALGETGPACYELFLARMAREVRRGKYPPPTLGADEWSTDELEELTLELFARNGRKLNLQLMKAASQDSLERLVTTICQNFLKDKAKASEAGKLRGRLETLLADDDRFARQPQNRWALVDGPHEPSPADRDDLETAAWSARGYVLGTLNVAGRTSADNSAALRGVAHVVMAAAVGSVHIADLAHVVGRRFDLLPWATSSLDVPGVEERSTTRVTASDGVGAGVAERDTAAAIVRTLDVGERQAVLHLADDAENVTALAKSLGCGRRQAAAILARTKEKIRLAVLDDGDVAGVLRRVVMLVSAGEEAHARIRSSDAHDGAPSTPVIDRVGDRLAE